MPEKDIAITTYDSRICDLNIYSKLWAFDSWPGVCADDDMDADDTFHDCEATI